MKLRSLTPVITALAALLLLASCSKTNKQGKMIPKEAGFVLHVNSKSLLEKVNMAEIKRSDWYKHIMEEMDKDSTAPEFVKKLHENIGASGIDSLADLIFFGENNSTEGMKIVLEGGIKDVKAFEMFCKNVYPEGTISKDGDIQSMPVKDKGVVTWNNEKFVMGIHGPSVGGMYTMGRNYDTTDNKTVSPQQIANYCKRLYTLKEDSSLAGDEKFTELMNTAGDLHAWVSLENLMEGSSLPLGMMSMIKLDAFTKGNVSTYTASFDNGRISLKTKNYVGKELGAILKKYSGGSINTDMIKSIPSDNVAGLIAFHFKPEGLKELVKLSGMDGLADLMLIRQGFSIDDFIKANKGDLLVAFTDIQMKKDSISFEGPDKKMRTSTYDKTDVKVLFSVAINDKDAFNKLLRAGKDMGGNSENIHYSSNANYFAIGNDENMITQYLAAGKHDQPFLTKISGSAIGGFVDIQKILKGFESDAAIDSISKRMWEESVKMWDNATITGGDFSGGGLNQLYEVNLMDKNTNSLKQLFQYGMNMSALEKEKMKKIEAEYKLHPPKTDTTVVVRTPRTATVRKKKK